MAISPWHVGQTAPAWRISLTTDSGAEDIAGLDAGDFTLLIRNTETCVETHGAGTFEVIQASQAIVQYQPATADVDVPGNFEIFVIATFPNGPAWYGPSAWKILPGDEAP